jgi:hypothetical protein
MCLLSTSLEIMRHGNAASTSCKLLRVHVEIHRRSEKYQMVSQSKSIHDKSLLQVCARFARVLQKVQHTNRRTHGVNIYSAQIYCQIWYAEQAGTWLEGLDRGRAAVIEASQSQTCPTARATGVRKRWYEIKNPGTDCDELRLVCVRFLAACWELVSYKNSWPKMRHFRN